MWKLASNLLYFVTIVFIWNWFEIKLISVTISKCIENPSDKDLSFDLEVI